MGYIELTKLMWALIQRLGSQGKLAKALRQSRPQITYWLNGDRKPRYEHILAMQNLLKKFEALDEQKKSQLDAIEALDAKSVGEELLTSANLTLSISEKTRLAMRHAASVGSRQGVRSDKLVAQNKHSLFYQETSQLGLSRDQVEKPLVLDASIKKTKFKGKTDAFVAAQVGLSKATYQRAKKVLATGVPELITAMDEEKMGIETAALLAALPAQTQHELLTQPPSEIRRMLKANTANQQEAQKPQSLKAPAEASKANHSRKRFVDVMQIYQDSVLLKIEKSLSVPARAVLIGLTTECDEQGKFIWQPELLKEKIMPFTNTDMVKVLEAFCEFGFIRHEQQEAFAYLNFSSFSAPLFLEGKIKAPR